MELATGMEYGLEGAMGFWATELMLDGVFVVGMEDLHGMVSWGVPNRGERSSGRRPWSSLGC